MAKHLGLKGFDRKRIAYWIEQGVFPQPKNQLKNTLVFFDSEEIELGFIAVANRSRHEVFLTREDIRKAKEKVLETAKAKNVSQFGNKLKKDW